MLMLAWARTRRSHARCRGDRCGRDEVRQARAHLGGVVRRGSGRRAARRGADAGRRAGALLRQRRRERDGAPAPHGPAGCVDPRHPGDPDDAVRGGLRQLARGLPPRRDGDRRGRLGRRARRRCRARANVPTAESTEYFAYASDAIWEQTLGLTFPGVFALIARAHMEKYGTTEEQMAAVAVKNHKHGTLNPKAQFQKAITVEQVLQSAYIADPLKLFDCCPFTDGGAAVVLASEEVARKRTRAVRVLASAAASDWMLLGDKRDLARVPATERAAAAAYSQAGLRPADVDVVELHDCFTIAEIVATEGLGLFEPGAGGRAAAEGRTSLGGAIPVNPSGGLKAKGHPIGATGAAQIAEIVTQLRGAAGPRQGADARVGLPHPLGGNTATVLVSLFGRD